MRSGRCRTRQRRPVRATVWHLPAVPSPDSHPSCINAIRLIIFSRESGKANKMGLWKICVETVSFAVAESFRPWFYTPWTWLKSGLRVRFLAQSFSSHSDLWPLFLMISLRSEWWYVPTQRGCVEGLALCVCPYLARRRTPCIVSRSRTKLCRGWYLVGSLLSDVSYRIELYGMSWSFLRSYMHSK